MDSLLSTVQMPKGIPVATFAIGSAGAVNAAIFAVQMLSMGDSALSERFHEFRLHQSNSTTTLE
jgi:5-(carboxyamino)imidazole ribonucleotide mutase